MRTSKDAENDIEKYRQELWKLKDKENQTLWPEMKKKYKGTYWVYEDNSYSCPIPGEYWDIYLYVNDVLEDGTLIVSTFQQDKDGTIIIDIQKRMRTYNWQFLSGYKKCTKRDYKNALKEIKKFTNKL